MLLQRLTSFTFLCGSRPRAKQAKLTAGIEPAYVLAGTALPVELRQHSGGRWIRTTDSGVLPPVLYQAELPLHTNIMLRCLQYLSSQKGKFAEEPTLGTRDETSSESRRLVAQILLMEHLAPDIGVQSSEVQIM